MLREYLSNIAGAIRSKLGTSDKVNAQDFADKVNEVYDKGKEDYRKLLWDSLQSKGTRKAYSNSFNEFWTKEIWYPIYDMQPTGAQNMFNLFDKGTTTGEMDLVERLAECGVTLDFSKCNNFVNTFSYAAISHIGEFNVTSCTSFTGSFIYSLVHTIDKLVVKDDGSQNLGNLFVSASRIKSIPEIVGKIGKTITFQNSPLDVPTMKRIISHLVNYAGTASEGVNKITFTVACWEALEASTSPYEDGLTDNETMKWEDYVGSLGWLV